MSEISLTSNQLRRQLQPPTEADFKALVAGALYKNNTYIFTEGTDAYKKLENAKKGEWPKRLRATAIPIPPSAQPLRVLTEVEVSLAERSILYCQQCKMNRGFTSPSKDDKVLTVVRCKALCTTCSEIKHVSLTYGTCPLSYWDNSSNLTREKNG